MAVVFLLLIVLALSLVVPTGLFAVTYAISTAVKTKRERIRAARATTVLAPPAPVEAGDPYRAAAAPPAPEKAPFPLAGVGLSLSVGSLFLGLLLVGGDRGDDRSTFFAGILGVATVGGMLGAAALGQRRSGAGWGAMVTGLLPWGAIGVTTVLSGFGAPGRPIRVRGKQRLPRVTRARHTAPPGPYQPRVVGLAPEARQALATLWQEDGRAEHASVPAFEHLANDLMLARAPHCLVEDARQAATDEVGHAAMCFGLASAYAGCRVEASPKAFAPHWSAHVETRTKLLERLAVESLIDGCVGEGAAAAEAWGASRRAIDPVVAAVLARIARDEETHAELAWAVVSWALETEATLEVALAREVARMQASAPARVPRTSPACLGEHGRLSSEERSRVWKRAVDAAAARLASLRTRPDAHRPDGSHPEDQRVRHEGRDGSARERDRDDARGLGSAVA